MDHSVRVRVAVLRGGPSHAYDESLKTGAHVLALLRELPDAYEPLDIFISRAGEWHKDGVVAEPHRILSRADVVWNALHGSYGEDGQVQRLLESLSMPFTGSGTMAASLSHNKEMSKALYRRHSLLTPESAILTSDDGDDRLIEIFRAYLHPVVVKPADGVKGLGVRLAHTFQELKDAVKAAFSHSRKVLVEEHVRGTDASCVVIEKAKGEDLYALLPSGKRPVEQNKRIEEMAKAAHQALGLRHYSGSDFIITPKGGIYILETNSLPVFHEDSLMRRSLEDTGWRSRDLVDHTLKLALNRTI